MCAPDCRLWRDFCRNPSYETLTRWSQRPRLRYHCLSRQQSLRTVPCPPRRRIGISLSIGVSCKCQHPQSGGGQISLIWRPHVTLPLKGPRSSIVTPSNRAASRVRQARLGSAMCRLGPRRQQTIQWEIMEPASTRQLPHHGPTALRVACENITTKGQASHRHPMTLAFTFRRMCRSSQATLHCTQPHARASLKR